MRGCPFLCPSHLASLQTRLQWHVRVSTDTYTLAREAVTDQIDGDRSNENGIRYVVGYVFGDIFGVSEDLGISHQTFETGLGKLKF